MPLSSLLLLEQPPNNKVNPKAIRMSDTLFLKDILFSSELMPFRIDSSDKIDNS